MIDTPQLEAVPATVALAEGRVAATATLGDATSTVVVERAGDLVDAKHVPIGTRRAGSLTLRIDGTAAVLRPGAGRFARRSYRVVVSPAGTVYRLHPESADSSRFGRDGRWLGSIRRRADGTPAADWFGGASETVTARDVAVAHALAAAFGTGAEHFWVLLLEGFGHNPV